DGSLARGRGLWDACRGPASEFPHPTRIIRPFAVAFTLRSAHPTVTLLPPSLLKRHQPRLRLPLPAWGGDEERFRNYKLRALSICCCISCNCASRFSSEG